MGEISNRTEGEARDGLDGGGTQRREVSPRPRQRAPGRSPITHLACSRDAAAAAGWIAVPRPPERFCARGRGNASQCRAAAKADPGGSGPRTRTAQRALQHKKKARALTGGTPQSLAATRQTSWIATWPMPRGYSCCRRLGGTPHAFMSSCTRNKRWLALATRRRCPRACTFPMLYGKVEGQDAFGRGGLPVYGRGRGPHQPRKGVAGSGPPATRRGS